MQAYIDQFTQANKEIADSADEIWLAEMLHQWNREFADLLREHQNSFIPQEQLSYINDIISCQAL